MSNFNTNPDAGSSEIYIELKEQNSFGQDRRLSDNLSEKESLHLTENTNNSKLKRNLILTLIFIVVISPGLLYISSSDFREFVKAKARVLSELKPSVSTAIIFWSIGFVLSLAAQHTVTFEIIIAYVYKEYLKSLFLILTYKILAIFCIYHVTMRFLYRKIENMLEQYDLFHLLRYLASRRPWKTLLILRFALLPKIAKNYGAPILGYHLYHIIPITCLSDIYFSTIAIIIGLTAISFVEIEDGNYLDDPSVVQYLPIIAGIVGALLVGYFFHYSRRVIKEVQQKYTMEQIRTKFFNRAPSTGSLRDIMD